MKNKVRKVVCTAETIAFGVLMVGFVYLSLIKMSIKNEIKE